MLNRSDLLAILSAGLVAIGLACGGGGKKGSEGPNGGSGAAEDGSGDNGDDGDVLIDEQQFEEIRTTFERKVNLVSRCFVSGLEAGEVQKNDKVSVTVGVTIQPDGSPADVRILDRSKKSDALEACVVSTVNRWLFTTLPKPLETSYIYTLQRF